MRVRVVDPAAYTPPYDHALCSALAAAGIDVELLTSKFRYGEVPDPAGYRINDHFYRVPGPMPVRLAQHPIDMLRLRRLQPADLTHFQWLPVQAIDRRVLPPGPLVLTAHDVVPREPRPGQLGALKATYRRVDAVIVHSEHGRDRLLNELDMPADRVHVIAHGAFDYLTRLQNPAPLPPDLGRVERPVVLFFGLLRPYKGIDLLIEAFQKVDRDAELWIVGMPRMNLSDLTELASHDSDRIKFVPRFVVDREIPAYFERADLVVLPYRQIDQSGVLYTALAFGKPMLLSKVGGFTEIAEKYQAAAAVEPNDSDALAAEIDRLLGQPEARQTLAAAARSAAAGDFSWQRIAGRTIALYESLLDRGAKPTRDNPTS